MKTVDNLSETKEITPNEKESRRFNKLQYNSRILQRLTISPIPSAEEIAKYKEVIPDLPEILIKQFELDSETERELKKEVQKADIELQKNAQSADVAFEKRSQWMAFIVIIAGLGLTFVLALLDKDTAATVTGISTLLMIFKGVFTKNKSNEPIKTDDKNE